MFLYKEKRDKVKTIFSVFLSELTLVYISTCIYICELRGSNKNAFVIFSEEILNEDHALWWSPSGRKMCYATFNDSEVKPFQLALYGEDKNLYTNVENIRWPKVSKTFLPLLIAAKF